MKTDKSIFANLKENLGEKELIDLILKNEKSYLTDRGAVGVFTGKRTSRSPDDKYYVEQALTRDTVEWGEYNHKMSPETFEKIFDMTVSYLNSRAVYSMDCYGGMRESESVSVRVFTDSPSQALFCKHMFLDAEEERERKFSPAFTIFSAPELYLDAKELGLNSEACIALDLANRVILVVGTGYTCEIKKAVFSIFNFFKPQNGVLCMHCSCNCEPGGTNSALFFGLGGTGKTTLSSGEGRNVVGDDQNGWDDQGIFNIEHGCYAKIFGITPQSEPDIYYAIRDGSMIENVVQGADGQPDFGNAEITENMRATYTVDKLEHVELSGTCEHPKNIFFLTADSLGVFPPISRLSKSQAMYYYLNGFTSKMGGTENKIANPEITFSSGFGAPFFPLPKLMYAKLLGDKLDKHHCQAWLVNTGWTGGPYGVGTRIKLKDTRTLIRRAIQDGFESEGFEDDGYLGLSIPKSCEELTANILSPSKTWNDVNEYVKTVEKVKAAFKENCNKIGIDDDPNNYA